MYLQDVAAAQGHRAGRADQHAVLGAGTDGAVGDGGGGGVPPGRARTPWRSPKSVQDLLPSIRARAARLGATSCRSTTVRKPSSNSVKDVQATLSIAFVLVVLVIFMFLGRATDTLIPAVALPLSLLLTFMAMNLLGYSLDNLSLDGLDAGDRVPGGRCRSCFWRTRSA